MGHQSFFKVAPCFMQTADQRQWSRKNGWSPPLHLLQLLAWFFIIMFFLLYFGVIAPNLPPGPWQLAAYIVNGMFFLIHIIIHVVSISVNPADPNVRAKNFEGPLPTFDRNRHAHVIENQFCYICEVKVLYRSKHCSTCNKCIAKFDHHCKWLNNCVGGPNYRLFIACISSALVGTLVILAASIYLIVAYCSGWLYTTFETLGLGNSSQPWYFTSTMGDSSSTVLPETTSSPGTNSSQPVTFFFFLTAVDSVVWLSFVVLTTILATLAILLLGHLLLFHVFLMFQGLTTYEYIIYNRDGKQPEKNDGQPPKQTSFKDEQCSQICTHSFSRRKANQISPMKQDGTTTTDNGDLEMQAVRKSDSEGQWQPAKVVEDEGNRDSEARLEQAVGNVYLGSPHRRQHLEPLYLRPKPRLLEAKEEVQVNADNSSCENEIKQDISSATAASSNDTANHGSRRFHQSLSPLPLSPILENRAHDSQNLHPSSRYLSVSQLSLNKICRDSTSDAEPEGEVTTLGDQQKNGSLSNLFLDPSTADEDELEPATVCHPVQEVQVPEAEVEMAEGGLDSEEINDGQTGDDNHPTDVHICSLETSDENHLRVVNASDAAVWAYSPTGFHNGLKGNGLISYKGVPEQLELSPLPMPEMQVPRWNSDDQLRGNADADILFHRRFSEDQNWNANNQLQHGLGQNPYRHSALQDASTMAYFNEFGKVFVPRVGHHLVSKKTMHNQVPCNIQSVYAADSARLTSLSPIF